MAQNQPQSQQGQQGFPQLPNNNQTARLQVPAKPKIDPFSVGAMSAGSAIQQAARAAAERRGGGGGQEGDFGLGTGAHGRQLGALDILSDTQGVDFGPYLQRILQNVKENWDRLIPESARMGKKGKLAIEFAIGCIVYWVSLQTAVERALVRREQMIASLSRSSAPV